jgi:hypothetical protein
VVRSYWSGRLRSGRVRLESWAPNEAPSRSQVEHITATSTVLRDQGKRRLAQRISLANCKAGALPAELHPHADLRCCVTIRSSPRSPARAEPVARQDRPHAAVETPLPPEGALATSAAMVEVGKCIQHPKFVLGQATDVHLSPGPARFDVWIAHGVSFLAARGQLIGCERLAARHRLPIGLAGRPSSGRPQRGEGRKGMDPADAAWRKSTYSTNNGCVEVAVLDGKIAVRDSKNRSGSVLQFTPIEWEAFLHGARDGEFDLTRGLL